MKNFITIFLSICYTVGFSQTDTINIIKGNGSYVGPGKYPGLIYDKGYQLDNRTLLNNPFLDSVAQASCTIVLNITVDSFGNVIDVSGPARGSTTTDSLLVIKSKLSAYKAKFNRSNILPMQKGKIIFKYVKRKL